MNDKNDCKMEISCTWWPKCISSVLILFTPFSLSIVTHSLQAVALEHFSGICSTELNTATMAKTRSFQSPFVVYHPCNCQSLCGVKLCRPWTDSFFFLSLKLQTGETGLAEVTWRPRGHEDAFFCTSVCLLLLFSHCSAFQKKEEWLKQFQLFTQSNPIIVHTVQNKDL